MPTGKPKYEVVLADDVRSSAFRGRRLCMPLSLPLPDITNSFLGTEPQEQKERLNSILQYVVSSGCLSFTVVLADILQRFAVMNAYGVTEAEALRRIQELAKPFVEMLKALIKNYEDSMRAGEIPTVNFELVMWDKAVGNDQCLQCKEIIERTLKENEAYLRALGSTALDFQRGFRMFSLSKEFVAQAYENNLSHVKEECAVYLSWDYDVILHPVKATEAINMTHKIFFEKRGSGLLHYVIFKLQKPSLEHTGKRGSKELQRGNDVAAIGKLFTSVFQEIQQHPEQMQLGITFVGEVLKYTAKGSQSETKGSVSLAAQLVFFSQTKERTTAEEAAPSATPKDDAMASTSTSVQQFETTPH